MRSVALNRRRAVVHREEEQLVLVEMGPRAVPADIAAGVRKTRRSSTRAWRLLLAIEDAQTALALRDTWDEVVRARLIGQLDERMKSVLAATWERRSVALRAGGKR
ncbi:MAG: hypothetical protein U0269_04280 [Polyangiales bacterium]